MSTAARWPDAAIDAAFNETVDTIRREQDAPALDAAMEAVVHAARLDFTRTVGLVDGTRSAQQVAWSAEILRVADPDADSAWAEHVAEQNANYWEGA